MSYTILKSSVMLPVKTWEREQLNNLRQSFTQSHHHCQLSPHKGASSQSQCLFSRHACVCTGAVFASAWRWRDYQRAVCRGVACIGCKLEASVRCFPLLSYSHSLPSVDSQAVLSVRWRQYKLAASAESAIGLNVLGVYHSWYFGDQCRQLLRSLLYAVL